MRITQKLFFKIYVFFVVFAGSYLFYVVINHFPERIKPAEILALTLLQLSAFFFAIDIPRTEINYIFSVPVYILSIMVLKQGAIFPYFLSSFVHEIISYQKSKQVRGDPFRFWVIAFNCFRGVSVLYFGAWIGASIGGNDFSAKAVFLVILCVCSAEILLLNTGISLFQEKPPWSISLRWMDMLDVFFTPLAVPMYLCYQKGGSAGLFLLIFPVGGLLFLIKQFVVQNNQRNESMNLLNIANELIDSKLEFHAMAKRAMEKVRAIFSSEQVELYIKDENGWEPEIRISSEDLPMEKLSVNMQVEELLKNGPVILDDKSSHPIILQYRREGFLSLLLFPLSYEEQLIGLVICAHPSSYYYTKEHLDFSKVITGQLSGALMGAKMHERLASALKELQASQAQLVQSEKMAGLGKLVAGVAHELNNPLNFISMQLPLIKSRVEELEELAETYKAYEPSLPNEDLELLNELKKSLAVEEMPAFFAKAFSAMGEGTTRCKRIVENLRTFARTETVGESWDFVDLNEAIDSTLILLTDRHENRVTLHKEYGHLPKVWCNAPQMNQVFMNLLANAFDAIEGEGEVWIKTEIQDGKCVISIRDSGQGIPDEIKARIFDPFFTTKEVGKGTGLGLSIVYSIVQSHKGEIHVESAAGKGTTFTVVIPLKKEASS